jgi:peptide/nickel transport system permease protein
MVRYVTRRLATAVLTICGVATIVFVMIRLVPGGIVEALSGPSVAQSPELIERLKEKYGLDKPLIVQYGLWLGNAVRGDLGESLGTRSSVASELLRRGSVTVELSLLATAVSLVVGLPAGVYAALRRFSPADGAVRIAALVFLSIPEFVLGTLLIYVVSTQGLGLPVSGYIPVSEDPWGHVRSMLLPTLSLGFVTAAVVMRVVRSSVIEALGEPFVTTARAKGLGERAVTWGHVMRTALIPTVTIVGINMGYLLSGAVIVEELFSLPGLGRFALQGILGRDYPVAQATVIVGAAMFVAASLLADVLYAYLDPRITY